MIQNLLTVNEQDIATDATGWTAVTNCTVTRSTVLYKHSPASLAVAPTVVGGSTMTVELARTLSPTVGVRLAYGGQFGDEPNDGNFVADGLVGSYGEPHPAMREVAWVYRPVTVAASGRRRVRITNRMAFTGLSALRGEWDLLVAGKVVQRGRWVGLEVAPLRSVVVDLPCVVPVEATDRKSVV